MREAELTDLLARRGFIAAEAEAQELLATAIGDRQLLEQLLQRRLTGEPLAWITGGIEFAGVRVTIQPGVYVPRWYSELLARRAIELLPASGVAIDLCTGSGAIAKALTAACPGARVLATELDQRAVACARANGIEVYHGDLFEPLPDEFDRAADVITAVVPYVPSGELRLLQRDTFAFEQRLSYDGGPDGTDTLRRVVAGASGFLRPGGALLVELGAGQEHLLADQLRDCDYGEIEVLFDDEGDVRGIEAARNW